MNKKSQMYLAWVYAFVAILIIIIIPFAVYYISSDIYKTLDSGTLNSIDYVCINNQPSLRIIQSNSSLETKPSPDDECSQECDSQANLQAYNKIKSIVNCENNQPVCNCQISYWFYYIKPLIPV
jgi:hypothetical protein